MKRPKIIFFVIAILLAVELQAFGKSSLSDLNVSGFQGRTKSSTASASNPFLKKGVSPSDMMVEDLTLTGIVYNPHEAYALISGYIVREGDDIAGFKIKVVERDHVVLRQLDQVKILRLE